MKFVKNFWKYSKLPKLTWISTQQHYDIIQNVSVAEIKNQNVTSLQIMLSLSLLLLYYSFLSCGGITLYLCISLAFNRPIAHGQILQEYRASVEWWIRGKSDLCEEKTCPSATLPHINLTWTVPRLILDLCVKKPVSICLSYGTTTANVPPLFMAVWWSG
jgi:hypothetical protein